LDNDFHSVKSEYCRLNGDNAIIQLPEEVTFDSNNEYIISIENRGFHRGVLNKSTGISQYNAIGDFSPPHSYMIVETNKTSHTESAIIKVNISPCYYWNLVVDVVNWH
jgi:hypothetical protein